MKTMYDDSTPPTHPPNTDAVAFYIGGDTPHKWTDAEIHRQTARYRLPIWVRSNPQSSVQGRAEGLTAVDWAIAHSQPVGTCIALDFETAVDASYVHAFDLALVTNGYKTLLYGSESAVLRNPKPSGGYWVALWDSHAALTGGWAAKQYASDGMLGKSWDLSVVADSTPLWDTQNPAQGKDEDMPYGTMIGKAARDGAALPKGRYRTIGFTTDNGLDGLPARKVRVAVLRQDHGWDVSHVTVDGTTHKQTVVSFVDPGNTVAVSLLREDDGAGEVWWEVS